MKKYRLLKLVSAVALLGAGAFALAPKKAESASAATTSVTLAGSFNSWSTSADPLTLNGDYYTIEKTLAVDDLFKIVVNGSDWVGDGDGVSWCAGLGSEGKGQNFKVLTAGKYRIKAASGIGDYGDKSYGIVFETVADVQYDISKYEVVDGVVAVSPFATEKVDKDAVYNVPAKVFKSGYSFDGWYTDSTCETPYTNTAITGNLNLYACYTSGTWSGTYKVELGAHNNSWSGAAANYAIYFFDTGYSPAATAWSTYVTGTSAGASFVNIPYSIDFEPVQMIVVRYSPSFTAEAWASNKWASDTDFKWGQTEDFLYPIDAPYALIRIGEYDSVTEKFPASTGYPKVIGGTSGAWNDLAYLQNYKTNGAGHPEFYDTSVYLPANSQFKVQYSPYQNDTYVASYTTHESISAYFSIDGESGNVVCSREGTYCVYFDDNTLTFYITTQALAEADEFAQFFLTVNCQGSMAQWSTAKARFNAMSADAKALFVAEAHVDHKSSVEGYVKLAVQRYDYILQRYGTASYEDFMGRVEAEKVIPGSLAALDVNYNNNSPTNLIVIVSVISLVSASTLVGLILLKKRKVVSK